MRVFLWQTAGLLLTTSILVSGQTIETAQQAAALTSVRYHYITREQRLKWLEDSTFGPVTLTVGLFSARFGTARDTPHEYGTRLDGFGKRYGMRLTGVETRNLMEAGLGMLWGED